MTNIRHQITNLAQQASVRRALDGAAERASSVVNEAMLLQQIPAPTFDEARRASYVQRRLEDSGLSDVSSDDLSVVYARLPGTDPDAPAVMVTAHLDTVFPPHTDLSLRRDGKRLYGPGLGDNSVGVAALLALPQILQAHAIDRPADIWLVGTIGEEGLGNLLGMQRAIERLGNRLGLIIVIEGLALGHVFHRGLGVRRLKVTLRGPGGHSWLDHGKPSAIHSLLKLGAALTDLPMPTNIPSSLNIGLIEGGTSINTIAPHASLSIDLRSEDAVTLDVLEERVRASIKEFEFPQKISTQIDIIGDRPAGGLPRTHPLVQASGAVLSQVGLGAHVTFNAASTDANLPLANGMPAVCVGITTGGKAHSADEYIHIAPVASGLQQLVLLTLAATHHSREWSVWDNVR
jgi:acetylornithine deacetylase/succinyl-diaminopimelate desuccinylase-like protein